MSRTRKKRHGFSVCGSSNAHAQSPVGTTDPEASSRSLLYICEEEGSGETALTSLLVANVISNIFSCAGSNQF